MPKNHLKHNFIINIYIFSTVLWHSYSVTHPVEIRQVAGTYPLQKEQEKVEGTIHCSGYIYSFPLPLPFMGDSQGLHLQFLHSHIPCVLLIKLQYFVFFSSL